MGSKPNARHIDASSLEAWLLTVHRDEEQHEEQFASRAEVFAAAQAVIEGSREAIRCITVIGPTCETWCATDFRDAAHFRKLPDLRDLASA